MIQDLKEDLDVDRIKRASPAVTTRSKVKEAKQQIAEEVNEGELCWLPLHVHHLHCALYGHQEDLRTGSWCQNIYDININCRLW